MNHIKLFILDDLYKMIHKMKRGSNEKNNRYGIEKSV